MSSFFDRPILNSPYEYPRLHWELDAEGQPTERMIDTRRRASFISPIPRAKKRKGKATQQDLDIGGEEKISSKAQKYDEATINELRSRVDAWRELKNPNDWGVTPETARFLQHWRHHQFNDIRPFFCQVEAVETLIWLTEAAPSDKTHGKRFIERLKDANEGANPGLMRLALKLATGAGTTTVMAMVIAWQTINAVRHPRRRAQGEARPARRKRARPPRPHHGGCGGPRRPAGV